MPHTHSFTVNASGAVPNLDKLQPPDDEWFFPRKLRRAHKRPALHQWAPTNAPGPASCGKAESGAVLGRNDWRSSLRCGRHFTLVLCSASLLARTGIFADRGFIASKFLQ